MASVPPGPSAVREMTEDDAAWAAALMEQRRQVYAGYSPVFWRPRPGVTGLHTRFLRRLIATPENAALRGDHAFIIAQPRPGQGFVDDFAVGQDGRWDADGAVLLVAAWRQLSATGCQSMRVVTAHADTAKSHMLSARALRLTEQWWVRELTPATPPASQSPS